MEKENCAHCRYWLFNAQKGKGDGSCRRYPPLIILVPDPHHKGGVGIATNFPELNGERGWCGEFARKTPHS